MSVSDVHDKLQILERDIDTLSVEDVLQIPPGPPYEPVTAHVRRRQACVPAQPRLSPLFTTNTTHPLVRPITLVRPYVIVYCYNRHL